MLIETASTVGCGLREAAEVNRRPKRYRDPATGHVLSVSQLTPRQRDVCALLPSGKTYREIGRILGVKKDTVGIYMQQISAEIGACGRSHVTDWVRSHP